MYLLCSDSKIITKIHIKRKYYVINLPITHVEIAHEVKTITLDSVMAN